MPSADQSGLDYSGWDTGSKGIWVAVVETIPGALRKAFTFHSSLELKSDWSCKKAIVGAVMARCRFSHPLFRLVYANFRLVAPQAIQQQWPVHVLLKTSIHYDKWRKLG